jgi:branched-chain amino acid transport system permease protein
MLSRARSLKIGTILVMFGLLLVLTVIVPLFFSGNNFLLNVFILANIYAILAMSWDILSGYTGQISFGHSYFFGIGGYTTALVGLELGWSPLFTIPLAGVIAAAGGLLIAGPALRLKGPYLALITLVASIGIDQLVRFLKIGSTGAEGAILYKIDDATQIITRIPSISGDYLTTYFISFGLMVLIAVALLLIGRSRIGLAFEAIRDDEEAAEAAGINAAKYKTLAFVISGFVAGLAGAFLVNHLGLASPSLVFALDISIEAIVASVLGGMGTIIGPIGGAYFYVLIRELLRPLQAWRFFVLFLITLLVLYFIPRGVLTEFKLRMLQWIKSAGIKLPERQEETKE